jgi:hypothetical protein
MLVTAPGQAACAELVNASPATKYSVLTRCILDMLHSDLTARPAAGSLQLSAKYVSRPWIARTVSVDRDLCEKIYGVVNVVKTAFAIMETI